MNLGRGDGHSLRDGRGVDVVRNLQGVARLYIAPPQRGRNCGSIKYADRAISPPIAWKTHAKISIALGII